ncbi:MAG TPA: hypothetical protein DCG39_05835 [Opitutae bacterium]|jgi:hypothetical protein|nr:hypothetical protein [Opitutae bacterium]HCY84514.1 hypothetical protein [Desulfobacteraceae bacterium]|tara:strand:- start:308 stop:766 length:459 start_codon:yes stop_codon:yes gene_type:complete
MKSHEVLKHSMEHVGVKTIASDLGVSPSLLYKWCQPGEEPTDSGATNPLDRLAKIFEATGDEQIISWLCQRADGFFCPNPRPDEDSTKDMFAHTQKLVGEFSDLLQVVSASYSEDGEICAEDSKRIRMEWEELKSVGESFLNACERGNFSST